MERRGKSSPASMVTWGKCKPYPKQHRMQEHICDVCPTESCGWHRAFGLGAVRRRTAKIDDSRVHFCTHRTRLTIPIAKRNRYSKNAVSVPFLFLNLKNHIFLFIFLLKSHFLNLFTPSFVPWIFLLSVLPARHLTGLPKPCRKRQTHRPL